MDEAIWRAFQFRDFDRVFDLVRRGADVNFCRKAADRTTALMAAAHFGLRDTVVALIKEGASTMPKDVHGQTAVDIAYSSGHNGVGALLHSVQLAETDSSEATLPVLSGSAGDGVPEAADDDDGDDVFDVFAQVEEEVSDDEAEPESMGAPDATAPAEKVAPGTRWGRVILPMDKSLDEAANDIEFWSDDDEDDDDDDSDDSNREDHPHNQYPEDEDEGDDSSVEDDPRMAFEHGERAAGAGWDAPADDGGMGGDDFADTHEPLYD